VYLTGLEAICATGKKVIDRKGCIPSQTMDQHALGTDFTELEAMKDKEDVDAKLVEVLESDMADDQDFNTLFYDEHHSEYILEPAEGEIFKQDAEMKIPIVLWL
jgi:hypothetical protein